MLGIARRLFAEFELTKEAKALRRKDSAGLPTRSSSLSEIRDAMLSWLCTAQDRSSTADGGCSRHYSLLTGWAASYPETTGYIVPTLLDWAKRLDRPDLRDRARRMLDWLVSIQFPDGGIQGGTIGATPFVPVTFNTGQVLIGFARGLREFGDVYRAPTDRAARWLVETLDPDGCWRKHPTPFASPGEKAYETHVSWGLYEAAQATGTAAYRDAAERNLRWALGKQNANGWFRDCDLGLPLTPLTHTIGYVLRGVLEAHRATRNSTYLDAAVRTAESLVRAQRADGSLPGRLDADWQAAAPWVCLTGNSQISICWAMLARETGDARYKLAASNALEYVLRTVTTTGPDGVRGGVRGSFPVDGDYGRFEFLNWAPKFTLDAMWELGYATDAGPA